MVTLAVRELTGVSDKVSGNISTLSSNLIFYKTIVLGHYWTFCQMLGDLLSNKVNYYNVIVRCRVHFSQHAY